MMLTWSTSLIYLMFDDPDVVIKVTIVTYHSYAEISDISYIWTKPNPFWPRLHTLQEAFPKASKNGSLKSRSLQWHLDEVWGDWREGTGVWDRHQKKGKYDMKEYIYMQIHVCVCYLFVYIPGRFDRIWMIWTLNRPKRSKCHLVI